MVDIPVGGTAMMDISGELDLAFDSGWKNGICIRDRVADMVCCRFTRQIKNYAADPAGGE